MPRINTFWVKMFFAEFCEHFCDKTDESIVMDVRSSCQAFFKAATSQDFMPVAGSFAEKMIRRAIDRVERTSAIRSEAGKKGMASRWGAKPAASEESSAPAQATAAPAQRRTRKPATPQHGYGPNANVMLTDAEFATVTGEIPNAQAIIDSMSEWMAVHGRSYKDYAAAIRMWYRKDLERNATAAPPRHAQHQRSFSQMEEDKRSESIWRNNADELLSMGIEPPPSLIINNKESK